MSQHQHAPVVPPEQKRGLILRLVGLMTPEDRRQLFNALRREFCLTCGGEGYGCRCWDDDLR